MSSGSGGPPAYSFEDRSILRPSAVRLYFSRLFHLLPRRVTANFVTLGGFGAMLGVLGFAAGAPDASPALLALVYFVGTQVYVAGDHLDGMQAVASRTTSPLGEFLDHFLDAVSGAILVLAAVTLMEGRPAWLLPAFLMLYLAAFSVTYVERAERRALHFHRVGALEGVVLASLFFATSLFPGGRAFWNAPLLAGVPSWWGLVGLAALTCLGTVAVTLRRIGHLPRGFGLYLLAVGAQAGALTFAPPALRIPAWLLLTLHGVEYLARVMQPQLHGHDARPDPVGPIVAVVAAGGWVVGGATGGAGWAAAALGAGTVWLAVRTAVTVGKIFGALSDHWLWVNPEPDEASGD